ncbi:MAG: iron-containing alcohol dehydrogenase [Candidatus Sumerlaeota bacterium]|nr:iron-containing alcohol dehydrogenase [Candidatus Sumerlaeota bacterium]
MFNFSYHNPVNIIFGKGTICQLAELLPKDGNIMLVYGGGSIKRNGVYDQVIKAAPGRRLIEFSGIEPNPRYETLMRAVEVVKREKINFLLAVGGGSVIDGVKFIAAAALWQGADPWDFMPDHGQAVRAALPLGVVLTLPATGSEMNPNSVVTRESTREKLFFGSPHVMPHFSILDPETTYTLPPRQTANGAIDAFVHVMEQYMTCPAGAPLQDRQAEAVLLTLIEAGPKALEHPNDYDTRASLMWAATQALNGLIGCGVPHDWTTHMIGHEITALYGLDHAVTLAIVLPAVWRHKRQHKAAKLLQYAARVWGIRDGDEDARINAAIEKTEKFFQSLGVATRLKDYDVKNGLGAIAQQCEKHGLPLGEHQDIWRKDVETIIDLCRE